MGRPPKAEARDTRQQLLDAALELFAEQGFGGTSMRQLARVVGVRESAIYHHFDSKEALFSGLLDEYGPGRAELLSFIDADVVVEVGVPEMLRNFAHHILEEWASPRERRFLRIVMSEAARLGASSQIHFPRFIERVVEAFSALFAKLIEKRVLRPGDPSTFAHEWMAGMMMIRMRSIAFESGEVDLVKIKALADAHVDFFWDAVRRRK